MKSGEQSAELKTELDILLQRVEDIRGSSPLDTDRRNCWEQLG